MRGYRRIRVDSDSQVAIKLVFQGCCMQHLCYNLIKGIHVVYAFQGHVTWKHILQEVNQVDEALAKQTIYFDLDNGLGV